MAANIFGKRFIARQNPAWWDTEGAHTFPEDEDMLVSEAVRAADMGYEIKKLPTFIEYEGQKIQTGKYAVVRPPIDDEDEPEIYSREVSESYGLLQNLDIARILDPISERWPVETVGALGKGERVFMLLKAGLNTVGDDDEIQSYFLVTDHKTGGGKLTLAYTPVRVVCQNTLNLALSDAEVEASMSHTKDVQDDLEMHAKLMHELEVAERETLKSFQRMIDTPVDDQKVKRVIKSAYPVPNKSSRTQTGMRLMSDEEIADMAGLSETQEELALNAAERWERRRDRQLQFQQAARERYEAFNDKHTTMARSVWAVYNGCTETSDWRRGTKAAGRSALVGARAREKERAFKTAWDIVNNS